MKITARRLDQKGEQIIVTTYEANGSLERYLDSSNLTWTQRLRICIGVARALSYLHSGLGHGYGVIHRFVNSSTVLLDENWEVKLSGFDISIKQSQGQVISSDHLVGTTGYFDPAMIKAKGVTYKSDIYSFGVVLFEILCGRKAYVQNVPNMFLDPLAKHHYENKTLQNIVHPDLWKEMSPKSLLVYSKVAYSCLEDDLSVRPDMGYIITQLEKALKAQTRRENIVNFCY
ncbi:putative receptor-like protein kinase At1g30570 [Bidens hawaiensis]|uniref:putative receptor-like protein kinase At1g30570 n=1 Tax=Bidens hawaiensis TaxID=980011 RepID=UPI00404B8EFC